MILSEKTLTYKNLVFCIEQGVLVNLVPEEDGAVVEFSKQVKSSNLMLIGLKNNDNLEISTINNPSSRSSNPLGFNYLGLRNIKHIIPIGQDCFLFETQEMLEFSDERDEDGDPTDAFG